MKLNLKLPTTLFLLSFVFLFLTSCSKDSDILSDYVVNNSNPTAGIENRVLDDTFILQSNNAIILDVLQNDRFDDLSNVRIIETSLPKSGTITINDDNTLTYTPKSAEPVNNETSNNPVSEPAPGTTEEPETTTEETETPATEPETTTTEPETTEPETSEPETTNTNTETDNSTEESTESTDNNDPPVETEETTGQENTTEEETDTFTYVTEEVNEDGEVTTEEGSVTISKTEVPTTGENVYFVTTNGNSSNDGRSEQSSWDIAHAFRTARAGDIVYVKAGDYGNRHLEVSNSGNENQPISFIGYTSQPGDVVASNSATVSYQDYKNQNDNVNVNYLPTLSGINEARENRAGSAIIVEKQYINISNFQIRKMSYGVYSNRASHIKLDNIIAVNIASEIKSQSGRAFPSYYLDDSYITNSIVINAGTGGLLFDSCDNNTILNNQVYSDNNINACDYYVFLWGDSSGNRIDNLIVEKVGDLEHPGHGLGGFHKMNNNVFTNFKIINTSLELSYAGVEGNVFKDFSITGNFPEQQYHNAIQIANGATNNRFENFSITNGNGIQFLEWDRGDTSEWNVYNQTNAGNNNMFINGEIKDCMYGVVFHHLERSNSPAENNTFQNITFENLSLGLFAANRPNYGNKMVDCRVNKVSTLWDSRNGNVLNFDFGNTVFSLVDFLIPN
ncbi:hypothetical protein Q2T41_16845 [Maribacter confluentis]|uniref:DUF1565 domain-containing protein n=1 Tax=Maribacter confluentis TaxID=1656093 RepID=A0ABT8RTT9_9FLAO|nr:Ig-like domain-containing protein [Maribacter confluentis]MDO1514324.1 hypothetical protein [Maribacter confluentis]